MNANSNTAHEKLGSIPVKVELSSGNVAPLLHEIRHAVGRLLQEGASTVIDLKSIPLAPGEEDVILSTLGEGEIRVELTVFGTSEITETGFAGVWVVTHCDENGATKARFIEITRIPAILCSQSADIVAGLTRLSGALAASTGCDPK